MRSPVPLPDARFFSHDAMHTTFTLRIQGEEEITARSMARECFARVDLLESRLSRFVEGSDVSRINCLSAGETLYISDETHRCLLLALEAGARTGGLFDISIGARIRHRKSGAAGPLPPLTGRLAVHPDTPAVTCEEPGREIDLGGIGKGFALDELRALLADWGAGEALLAAGASSLLAIGPRGWPVDLTGDAAAARVYLENQSLSASGTGIQGAHIVHPLDGLENAGCSRIWVTAADAALAEVWSTALMLIGPADIAEFIAGEPGVLAVHGELGGEISQLYQAGPESAASR
jgi:thiamine biosynthesis lipoprotein